jgi:hypothetical protein
MYHPFQVNDIVEQRQSERRAEAARLRSWRWTRRIATRR